jgi:hypothetical protein
MPDPKLIAMEVLIPQDIQHETVTKEYDVEHPVPRNQVLLQPELITETKAVSIPAKEERIVEVPETRMETRVVEVPEVTTTKTVYHVPTYPTQTNRHYYEPLARVEPLTFDQIDANHDGVISRGEFQAALARPEYAFDGADGRRVAEEVQRLRGDNLRLEQDGRQMQADLKRRHAEEKQLAQELAEERRRIHELDVRMLAAQQSKRVDGPSPPASGLRRGYERHVMEPMSSSYVFRSGIEPLSFDQIDTNHDGVISRGEFQAALARRPWAARARVR